MIAIRPMTIEDCQAVCEIDQLCFSDAWKLSMFEELFQYPTNYYFVAEETDLGTVESDGATIESNMNEMQVYNSRICGFAGITVSVDTADVMNIGVLPEFRRKKIGRMLLDSLVEQGRKCGCEQMMLEVRESNQSAIQLYETSGFTQIAVRKNYYAKPTEHGIIMQRTLA